MPPACSLLGIATPTPPEMQPFRFFDLPKDIRYMVYEYSTYRFVRVKIPDLVIPCCVSEPLTVVDHCFQPAMMRVSKRFGDEYVELCKPTMILRTEWICNPHEHDYVVGGCQNYISTIGPSRHPDLPERVLAELKYIDIRLSMHDPTPHCDMQSMIRSIAVRMTRLSLLLLSTEYEFDRQHEDAELRPNLSFKFGIHKVWKHGMTSFLEELVKDNPSLKVEARSYILCDLWCPLTCVGWDFRVSSTGFVICNKSDEYTFHFDGLDVMFAGIDMLLFDQDDNTYVSITNQSGG